MICFWRIKRAQNLIEYALVVAVLAAATVAMSTYVYRAVQTKQKQISEQYAQ
jgi:Flp pilus assembly pilin Flp